MVNYFQIFSMYILNYIAHKSIKSILKQWNWCLVICRSSSILTNATRVSDWRRRWKNTQAILTRPKQPFLMIYSGLFTWWTWEEYKSNKKYRWLIALLLKKCLLFKRKSNKLISNRQRKLKRGSKMYWLKYRSS